MVAENEYYEAIRRHVLMMSYLILKNFHSIFLNNDVCEEGSSDRMLAKSD